MSDGTNPQDPTADAVVPPPPPETPLPDNLIPPPSAIPDAPEAETPAPPYIAPADAVIPPPPAEAQLRSTRRSTPVFDADGEDRPSAAADDWAQPSVAPEAPTSGGYGVLTGVIFTVLVLLLIGAVVLGVVLATTTSFPWASGAGEPILTAVGISAG